MSLYEVRKYSKYNLDMINGLKHLNQSIRRE